MSKKERSITIKLTFTEDDLQSLLDAANFTDNESLQVSELRLVGRLGS